MTQFLLLKADKKVLGYGGIVVKNECIYLRILQNMEINKDQYPWKIVTATAKDDSGAFSILSESKRDLANKVAQVYSLALGAEQAPSIDIDNYGRRFVTMGCFSVPADFIYDESSDLFHLIADFFTIYEAAERRSEMILNVQNDDFLDILDIESDLVYLNKCRELEDSLC